MRIRLVIIAGLICFLAVLVISSFINSCEIEHRREWWYDDVRAASPDFSQRKNIKVAVIDSGIDITHKDLKSAQIHRIVMSGCYEKGKRYQSHGTSVLGVIAAYPCDVDGLLGLSPKAKIIAIDVTHKNDVKMDCIVKGIYRAIEEEADIINISIGTDKDSSELYKAIRKAYDNNILVVCAAGNVNSDQSYYPASYEEVLRVGGKNKANIATYRTEHPTIYMPGENIVSLDVNSDYRSVSGSSIACGIATGVLANFLMSVPSEIDVKDILDVCYSDECQNDNCFERTSLMEILKERLCYE